MLRKFITILLLLSFIIYQQCIVSTDAVHSTWPLRRRRKGKRTFKHVEVKSVYPVLRTSLRSAKWLNRFNPFQGKEIALLRFKLRKF